MVGAPADETTGTASSGLFAQIERIDEELAKKVTQTEGARLMTDMEGLKLAAMLGIYSHSDELNVTEAGELQIEKIEQEKVSGLPAALAAKIETIKIGEEILYAENGEIELPTAANGKFGVVMGSEGNNSATVNEDGTLEVNTLSVSKLVQDEDELLVLNGGNAFVK